MPAQCNSCGTSTTRYVTKFVNGKMIDTCSVCEHPPVSDQRVGSMFTDLTLEHVLDEQGKPVRVTSLRELRAAERKYKFRSVVANEDEKNFDRPPQSSKESIAEAMTRENRWMYPEIALPMLKELRERGEVQ